MKMGSLPKINNHPEVTVDFRFGREDDDVIKIQTIVVGTTVSFICPAEEMKLIYRTDFMWLVYKLSRATLPTYMNDYKRVIYLVKDESFETDQLKRYEKNVSVLLWEQQK